MPAQKTVKALFVDTDPTLGRAVELYVQGFSRKTLDIKSVASAAQAFELGRDDWDVILAEINTRDDPRGAIVHQIKERYGHIPVVNLGERDEMMIAIGTATTLDEFLPKIEVSAATLLRSVRNLLGRRALEDVVESLRRELAEASRNDSATGLWNRGHMTERVAEEFMTWKRYGVPTSLCLFEIVGLDEVSETYGFEVAEGVLRKTGALVEQCKRGCDLAGRFGEATVCVLFTNTPAASALVAVRRMKDAIEHELFMGKTSMNFTVRTNFALVEFGEEFEDLPALLRGARQTLKIAVKKGPSHIEFRGSTEGASGPSVLIVDDHTATRNLCCDIFQQQGYRTSAAHSLREAEQVMTENKFDLFVIDLRLPDGDGEDLIARIAENCEHAPPVIVITGRVFIDNERLKRLGIRHILPKPFSPEEINAIAAELLDAA